MCSLSVFLSQGRKEGRKGRRGKGHKTLPPEGTIRCSPLSSFPPLPSVTRSKLSTVLLQTFAISRMFHKCNRPLCGFSLFLLSEYALEVHSGCYVSAQGVPVWIVRAFVLLSTLSLARMDKFIPSSVSGSLIFGERVVGREETATQDPSCSQ